MLILHSDGLSTHTGLDNYPRLAACRSRALSPALLYRDFSRGNDDATVVVVKAAGMTLPILSSTSATKTIPWRRGNAPARSRAFWGSIPGPNSDLNRCFRNRAQCLQLRRRRPGGISAGRPYRTAVADHQGQRLRARDPRSQRHPRRPLSIEDGWVWALSARAG